MGEGLSPDKIPVMLARSQLSRPMTEPSKAKAFKAKDLQIVLEAKVSRTMTLRVLQ